MKHKIVSTGFAIALIVTWMGGVAAPAHAGEQPCSVAGAAGNWGFTDTGRVPASTTVAFKWLT